MQPKLALNSSRPCFCLPSPGIYMPPCPAFRDQFLGFLLGCRTLLSSGVRCLQKALWGTLEGAAGWLYPGVTVSVDKGGKIVGCTCLEISLLIMGPGRSFSFYSKGFLKNSRNFRKLNFGI